jgi:hypothetical protein
MTRPRRRPNRRNPGDLIEELAPILRRCIQDPDTGCWLWTGATTRQGYPRRKINGRNVAVHRLVLATFVGLDLTGLVVHHRVEADCSGNPRCVNPRHLAAMTSSEHSSLHGALRALILGPAWVARLREREQRAAEEAAARREHAVA